MSPASDLVTMSSSTSSDSFRFARLTGANYTEWATNMKSALQSKYLWLVTDGREPCPSEPPKERPTKMSLVEWKAEKKEYLNWQLRNEAAQGFMKSAAEPSQWPHVNECKTAKEMWDTWKKLHVDNQQKINVHYFFEELYMKKYVDGTPMADHIAKMLDIRNRITAAGEDLPDINIARALILSLPKTPTWELIKIQLFGLDTLTSEIVSTKLQAEANRRMREKSGTETALHTNSGKRSKKGKGKPNESSKGPKPDDVYRYCKGTGHWANKCPRREEDEKAKRGGGESSNLTVRNLRDLGTREVGQIYMARKGQATETADVLLDCGASAHMFCDRGYFRSYTANGGNETISVGDARDIPVTGAGSIELKCRLPNGTRTVVLHGVLHVPRLAANLVSLGTLQRAGAKHHSQEEGIMVTLGPDELFRASFPTSTATLYHIDLADQEVAFATIASGSLRVWH